MKQIPLTQGKFALVDDDDFEELNKLKWYAQKSDNENYYACGFKRKMHRLIMRAIKGQIIDHRDGNGLNNQKSNLRICTNSQNQMNKKASGSSKYIGVSLQVLRTKYNTKSGEKVSISTAWLSTIKHKSRYIYIGRFKDELHAAIAYNEAAKKYHGEFARLNQII